MAVVSKGLGVSDQTPLYRVELDRNGQLDGSDSKPVGPAQRG